MSHLPIWSCRSRPSGVTRAVCPPSDGEADVAVHLPVRGQAVQGDHRAGGEGRQPSSQLLLLHQDRHGRQGEEPPTPPTLLRYMMDPLFTSARGGVYTWLRYHFYSLLAARLRCFLLAAGRLCPTRLS